MQGKKLTTEQRAIAIALLLAGETVALTAKRVGVSERAVSTIKASSDFAELCSLKRESEPSLSELVTQHLTTSRQAAIALAQRVTMDDEWFSRQSAYDIAMLYGTLSDKSIRIYDASLRAERTAFEKRQLETGGNPDGNGELYTS